VFALRNALIVFNSNVSHNGKGAKPGALHPPIGDLVRTELGACCGIRASFQKSSNKQLTPNR